MERPRFSAATTPRAMRTFSRLRRRDSPTFVAFSSEAMFMLTFLIVSMMSMSRASSSIARRCWSLLRGAVLLRTMRPDFPLVFLFLAGFLLTTLLAAPERLALRTLSFGFARFFLVIARVWGNDAIFFTRFSRRVDADIDAAEFLSRDETIFSRSATFLVRTLSMSSVFLSTDFTVPSRSSLSEAMAFVDLSTAAEAHLRSAGAGFWAAT